jgi:hypothetical protein
MGMILIPNSDTHDVNGSSKSEGKGKETHLKDHRMTLEAAEAQKLRVEGASALISSS